MSSCGLAAGDPWMPTAFCSWSYFTGHPATFTLANSAMLWSVTPFSALLFALCYWHTLVCVELRSHWTLLAPDFFFFSSILPWVLFIFITCPKEYIFMSDFPVFKNPGSGYMAIEYCQIPLMFLIPLISLATVFSGPASALSCHISLVGSDSRTSDLEARDVQISGFSLISKTWSSQRNSSWCFKYSLQDSFSNHWAMHRYLSDYY